MRIVLSQNTFPAKTRLRVVCMAGVADAASKTKKKQRKSNVNKPITLVGNRLKLWLQTLRDRGFAIDSLRTDNRVWKKAPN